MKKFLIFFLFISLKIFGQSTLITPNGSGNGSTLIKKDGIGIDHQDETGAVRVGTYSNVGIGAFIQTHSAHPLRFTVANGTELMRLSYSLTPSLHGNLGIATPSPQEKLHVNGNIRASSLAGTATRPVFADANGTLLPITTPQVWSINAGAFSPITNIANFQQFISYATFNSGTSGAMFAPVNLPTGVTISEIKVFYEDNSSNLIDIKLSYQALFNSNIGTIVVGHVGTLTSINVTGIQSANLNLAFGANTIDNANRAYYLEIASSNWTGLRIYSFKITYSY